MIKIATIQNGFTDKFGIPRQSGRVETLSKIVFEKEFKNKDAIRRIEEFSHLWLIFGFSKAEGKYSLTVRPPRLGGNEKVGVFASRSPFRPNNLGLSSVKLIKIDEDGSLIVSGADLLSGTPIYDIKPYLPFTDCHKDATCGYAKDFVDYNLQVENEEILNELGKELKKDIISILCEDPRPAYQDDDREYKLDYKKVNVTFKVKNQLVTITQIKKLLD